MTVPITSHDSPPTASRLLRAQALGSLLSRLAAGWRIVLNEMRRLNNTGFALDEFASSTRRERARIVRRVLEQRHSGINHCC